MINQIKYLASWSRVKMNQKLGQRGAEMVEYAIVLACIAAVGVYFYSTTGQGADSGLKGTLTKLWKAVDTNATPPASSSNTTTQP